MWYYKINLKLFEVKGLYLNLKSKSKFQKFEFKSKIAEIQFNFKTYETNKMYVNSWNWTMLIFFITYYIKLYIKISEFCHVAKYDQKMC